MARRPGSPKRFRLASTIADLFDQTGSGRVPGKSVHLLRAFSAIPLSLFALTCELVNVRAQAAGKTAKEIQIAITNVDRVVVEPFDGWIRPPKKFAIREVGSLVKLLSTLEIQDAEMPPPCACRGAYAVHFYSGKRELASVFDHNGLSLHWRDGDGWGYAKFPERAVSRWRGWFSQHGYSQMNEPHARDARDERFEKLREDEWQEFLRQFPESVRACVFETDFAKTSKNEETRVAVSQVAKKVAAAFPDKASLCKAICSALGGLGTNGTKDAGWGAFELKRYFAHDVAKIIEGADFETVVGQSKDDLRILRGAAHLFFAGSFHKRVRKEDAPAIAALLARTTFENDIGGNGNCAMQRLGQYVDGEPLELLKRVALGEIECTALSQKSWEDAPSLRASACIYMARNGHTETKRAIEALAKQRLSKRDSAALDIARAFCGARGRISKAHFSFASEMLGRTALEALERLGGTDSLAIVIECGTRHPWAAICGEAVMTAQRMTGAKWVPDGADPSMPASIDAARSWWAKSRADLRRMRKE